MTLDPNQSFQVESSPARLIGIGLLGILMTAGSGAIALGMIGKAGPGDFVTLIGWVGLIFFGACTVFAFKRAVSTKGPVITMSPQGLRDPRVAEDTIPWDAVQSVSEWAQSGQKVVVVSVFPEYEATMTLSRIARMSRKANAALGADGLAISAQGTKISHDDLMTAVLAYLQAHADPASLNQV